MKIIALVASGLLAFFCTALAQDPPKLPGATGPLVGHVTAESAELWMFYENASAAKVFWKAEGREEERSTAFRPVELPATPMPGRPAFATLDGLEPGTQYRYRVEVDGKSKPNWEGTFGSAPAAGAPGKFRLGLTSCMKIGQSQSSWYLFSADKPDLHLTLGDTHYADTTDPKSQWEHHLRYRNQREFAAILRGMPTYAMWDDHDYGPNDSDGTEKMKHHSLAGWKQFWPNPPMGAEGIPGAFFKFAWGDVDFFVVDGRYHRSPDKAEDNAEKRMLGDAQFAWLVDGLKKSKAKFKVIASGSTLHFSKGDGWRIYTFSRRRLFDAIRENRVDGVVYMCGDIHRSLTAVHGESDRVGYPLVEVISSGIANSSSLSYATIDFDTAVSDPSMRVRIVHGDATVREDKTWKLSELSHMAEETPK